MIITILARRWTAGHYVFEAATVVARITADALLVRFADGMEQSAFEWASGIPAEFAGPIAQMPVDHVTLNRAWAQSGVIDPAIR